MRRKNKMKKCIYERSMFSMFCTHPVINEHIKISRNRSCHPWTNHIIDERIASPTHKSCHLCARHTIKALNTSYHQCSEHIISSRNPLTDISCLQWPNHIVDELIISSWNTSCHLRMYQSIYDYITLSMNCSRAHHDNSQHIMTSRNTSCIMSSTNTTYGRMGHEIWSTHLIHPLFYDVSPMEPDGLSHGHWTQMQGDDF